MLLPSHFGFTSPLQSQFVLHPLHVWGLTYHVLVKQTASVHPTQNEHLCGFKLNQLLGATGCSHTNTRTTKRGAEGDTTWASSHLHSAGPLICFGPNWAHNQHYTLLSVLSNLTNAYPGGRINFWGSSLCCSSLLISSSVNITPPEPPHTCPSLYSNPKLLNKSHFHSGWGWLWTLSKQSLLLPHLS